MIGKIRGMSAEMERLKYELEMSRMETDKTEEELRALRTKMSRRLAEYEGEIRKLQEGEKKWRIKVQKLKSDSCKRLPIEAKIDPTKVKPSRFLFKSKRQDSEQSLEEKNSNNIFASVENYDEKQQDDGKEEAGNTLNHKLNTVDVVLEKAKSLPLKLTHRQKQIKYLEERDDLAAAEEIKLGNLKDQEMCWIKLEM